MLLNSLSVLRPNLYKIQKEVSFKNSNVINFTSQKDSFSKSLLSSTDFNEDILDEQKAQILANVEDILTNPQLADLARIGFGVNGAVYKVSGVDGFPSGLAVKISHSENRNTQTNEMQRIDCNFLDEQKILQEINGLDDKSQKFVANITLQDGRHALVTTFVDGKNPELGARNLNIKNIAALLKTFEKLDELGILHRDLKAENVVIDEDDNAGLIDFGEAIKFDVKDWQNSAQNLNFPEFVTPTNLKSFEDTLLFPYLDELKAKNPASSRKMFVKYLSLKVPFYQRKADYIETVLSNCELDETTRQKLLEMKKYNEVMAQVLANPSADVVQAENLNGQITYNSEMAYKNEILLLNPLANVTLKMNSVIAAKKLEAFSLEQLKKPNTLEKRQYFIYQNQCAKYYLDKVSGWLKGLVNWIADCSTTDIETAPDYKQDLINQMVTGKNLNKFDIPDIDLYQQIDGDGETQIIQQEHAN